VTVVTRGSHGRERKKTAKPSKMRALRVDLDSSKKAAPSKAKKAAPKTMSFTEWVENYVKASKGNPV
jgi:hypothetical protein